MRVCLASVCLLMMMVGWIAENPTVAQSNEGHTDRAAFDSVAAWAEFESEIRLRYAYLERDDFDVDQLLDRSRALAEATSDRAAFRRILHQTTFAFTDPHFIVGPFDDDDFNIIPTSSDLQIGKRDGKFVVLDVRANSAADQAGVRPGWQLETIEGVSIADALLWPFGKVLDSPTDKQIDYGATVVANGRRKGKRTLKFLNEGTPVVLTLPSPREFAKSVANSPIVEFSRIGEIGVIQINNSLGNNKMITEFDQVLKELSDTKGLVIDVRNTPSGGNTEVARSIMGHFVKEVRSYQVHEIPSLEREFTVPRRFIEQVKPRLPFYGPDRVVVLGGFWTGSMGEGLVIGLDGAAEVKTIASNMGDLLGALSNIDLRRSKARMDLGTESLFHINGQPREDYLADIQLQSADRSPDGSDPAMQAALEFLKQVNNE